MTSTNSFYSIRIPTPLTDAQQIAQIIVGDDLIYTYWLRETRQVLVHVYNTDTWYIQPDAKIVKSLATILECDENNIETDDLFLFEKQGHGKPATAQEAWDFYECEWSDYASDKIGIQFTVDECYDMPPLMNIEPTENIEQMFTPYTAHWTYIDTDGEYQEELPPHCHCGSRVCC